MVDLISLIATPLLVFISTAHDSYLKNQVSFGYNPQVLLTYYHYAVLVFGVGIILYVFRRNWVFRRLLWLYYFFGPLFLGFIILRQRFAQLNEYAGFALFILVSIMIIYVASRFMSPARFTRFMAHLSLLLVATEIFNFAARYKVDSSTKYLKSFGKSRDIPASQAQQLPNIYHIVFDEYQTDMFEGTLTKEIQNKLAGFTYFPKNTTVYGRTRMSFASAFLGKSYAYDQPQIDYLKSAYNSKQSILHTLKKEGYWKIAYLHKVHPFKQPLIDGMIEHKDNINRGIRINYSPSFRSLWIFKNTPRFVAKRLIPDEHFTKLTNRNLLTNDAPIRSLASFQNYLKDEKDLPSRGRYTFIHLILPHFPNVLEDDCSYEVPVVKETTPRAQTICTNSVLVQFIDNLKKLDRFEDSLIVVNADHGSRYEIRDGEFVNIETDDNYTLEYSWTRSRALLMIKPPGVSDDTPFLRSNLRTQNTDIAPTISGLLDIKIEAEFEGLNLLDKRNESAINTRTRYYFYLDKADDNETTETFTRYIVHDDRIERERVFPVYRDLVE